ncbi:PREDICTED: uncharacterized protein LOC109181645 [Ipomoea nil]|uniref:uncharacterized protein LOC109181645 n=1 Tax=Ipomoea nil TaxID=35883 RepID=UPI00090181BD|nr:PREDICTED: uncharacterized protein LOC109181645 [Ipomoea nil]
MESDGAYRCRTACRRRRTSTSCGGARPPTRNSLIGWSGRISSIKFTVEAKRNCHDDDDNGITLMEWSSYLEKFERNSKLQGQRSIRMKSRFQIDIKSLWFADQVWQIWKPLVTSILWLQCIYYNHCKDRAAESQLSLKAFHTSTCPCKKKNSVLHKENCHLSATVIRLCFGLLQF